MILLITTGKAVLVILGTILMIALCFMLAALARGASPEVEEDDVPGRDMEPVNYSDIMDAERPYYQYN